MRLGLLYGECQLVWALEFGSGDSFWPRGSLTLAFVSARYFARVVQTASGPKGHHAPRLPLSPRSERAVAQSGEQPKEGEQGEPGATYSKHWGPGPQAKGICPRGV